MAAPRAYTGCPFRHACRAFSPYGVGTLCSARPPPCQEDGSSVKTDALVGGHGRGHLGALVLWPRCDAPLARPLYPARVAHLHVSGLWVGPGHGPSHHHDLCVADGGNRRHALFTLLSHVQGGTNGRGMVSKSARNGRPPSPLRAFVRTAASLISSGVAAHHILELGPSHDLYNTTRRKGCKDLAQSAWKRRKGRIVSPRARAVLRLMTSSPGIGCPNRGAAPLAL